MENSQDPNENAEQSREDDAQNSASEPKVLPHASEKSEEDAKPPLYISGFGVMGQSVPDVATGSTPLTRKDD